MALAGAICRIIWRSVNLDCVHVSMLPTSSPDTQAHVRNRSSRAGNHGLAHAVASPKFFGGACKATSYPARRNNCLPVSCHFGFSSLLLLSCVRVSDEHRRRRRGTTVCVAPAAIACRCTGDVVQLGSLLPRRGCAVGRAGRRCSLR